MMVLDEENANVLLIHLDGNIQPRENSWQQEPPATWMCELAAHENTSRSKDGLKRFVSSKNLFYKNKKAAVVMIRVILHLAE